MCTDFNNFANTWDTAYRINRARIISHEIATVCQLNRQQNIMEFGCGTGLIGFNLINTANRIDFVDTSSEMVKIVKEKGNNLRYDQKLKVFERIEAISRSERYDCIYSSMVIHHITDIEMIGMEFYRRIAANGKLCIVDLNKDDGLYHQDENGFNGYHGFEPNELAKRFEGVGFRTILYRTFYYDIREIEDQKVPYSLFILLMGKKTE